MPVTDEGWTADAGFPPQDDAGDVTGSASFDGPSPVDTPGDSVLEPHRGGDEDENEPTSQKGKDPLPEFDPRVRQDFEGLLFLGRLTHTFTWAGHEFIIRTLTTGETLEVGLLAKPYQGSMAAMKAYQAALVAACVDSVDGRPMPVPITDDARDTSTANRFRYVLRSWFPPVLDAVYEQYLLLEERVTQVLDAMGKAPR
jgi:hypothetical protein